MKKDECFGALARSSLPTELVEGSGATPGLVWHLGLDHHKQDQRGRGVFIPALSHGTAWI